MNTPQAFLFDIDGTLLDTRHFIESVVRKSLDFFSIPQPPFEDLIEYLVSNRMREYCKKFRPELTEEDYWKVDHAFQEQFVHLSRVFDGIPEMLSTLHAAGYKIGAVTSRTNKTSFQSLQINAIDRYFDTIVSAEDVTFYKPNPESIHLALKRLDILPHNACMIGDSSVDILAGKNAGTATIAVTYGFEGMSIASHHPDYVIHTPHELLTLFNISEVTTQTL